MPLWLVLEDLEYTTKSIQMLQSFQNAPQAPVKVFKSPTRTGSLLCYQMHPVLLATSRDRAK